MWGIVIAGHGCFLRFGLRLCVRAPGGEAAQSRGHASRAASIAKNGFTNLGLNSLVTVGCRQDAKRLHANSWSALDWARRNAWKIALQ
jgi:hypothetical protein